MWDESCGGELKKSKKLWKWKDSWALPERSFLRGEKKTEAHNRNKINPFYQTFYRMFKCFLLLLGGKHYKYNRQCKNVKWILRKRVARRLQRHENGGKKNVEGGRWYCLCWESYQLLTLHTDFTLACLVAAWVRGSKLFPQYTIFHSKHPWCCLPFGFA